MKKKTTPAQDGGDSWNWISVAPAPYSGEKAHQSSINPGRHQHFFSGATEVLAVNPGDRLYAYVYPDPANMPEEIMLQWNDGTWEHRAYWGADKIAWGASGSASRHYMGL